MATSYTYNSRGLRESETYPDHTGGLPGDASYGQRWFEYDGAARLLHVQDQADTWMTMVYDMASRMTAREYRTGGSTGTPIDSDTFVHDRAGRMTSAVSGRYSNTVSMDYDSIGRLNSESLAIGGQTYVTGYTRDARNQLFQLTYPNGTVAERTYTARGQLGTNKLGSNIEDTRSYDAGGRLVTSALRNGVTETRTYRNVTGGSPDPARDNMLASIAFAHPGGTPTNRKVGDLTYSWDANRNKTAETITGTMSGYSFDTTLGTDPDGYDEEDRLTYFKRSNNVNPQTWNLSLVGD